jgi:CheY-like chemotaxis protein
LSVLQASDGAAALKLALDESPDAILMDISMPVMDGIEATRALRAQGYSAPILVLTGFDDPVEQRRALAAGCNTVLVKPVSRTSLQAALEAALAPRQAPEAAAR